MFGYLDVNKQTLQQGQLGLWQTFMCGLCVSTKNLLGNFPRMLVSNDVNTFNMLFHSVLQQDVVIDKSRCVAHFVKKRTILRPTELTDKLALGGVILAYYNLYDDVVDGNGKKKIALKALQKYYDKAKKAMPNLDQVVKEKYQQLREYEQSGCNSLDVVCDSFAQLSQHFCQITLLKQANLYVSTLCYNLGKWIYLIDALDDLPKDLAKGNYNVFAKCYNLSKASDLAKHFDEVQFTMYAVLNRIAQCYNDLNLTKYTCILRNVLLDNVRNKTQQILNKYKMEN